MSERKELLTPVVAAITGISIQELSGYSECLLEAMIEVHNEQREKVRDGEKQCQQLQFA